MATLIHSWASRILYFALRRSKNRPKISHIKTYFKCAVATDCTCWQLPWFSFFCLSCRYSSHLGKARDFGIKKGIMSGLGMGFFQFTMFGSYALAFWWVNQFWLQFHPICYVLFSFVTLLLCCNMLMICWYPIALKVWCEACYRWWIDWRRPAYCECM